MQGLAARKTGIFINYRREDSSGDAGRLCDRLSRTFSQDEMFIDVDDMKPGIDFAEQIDEEISKCAVVLAVIGPGWLDAKDEKGRRRLEQPRDHVRIELATALKRAIPVIPLLVNGTVLPSEDDLPEDLKALPKRHALELRHSRFAADSDAVIKALNDILRRPKRWLRRPKPWRKSVAWLHWPYPLSSSAVSASAQFTAALLGPLPTAGSNVTAAPSRPTFPPRWRLTRHN